MKLISYISFGSLFITTCLGSPFGLEARAEDHSISAASSRAKKIAGNELSDIRDSAPGLGLYAPKKVDCPADPTSLIRVADSLSDEEFSYIKERKKVTATNLQSFMDRLNVPGMDLDFVQKNSKHVNIAMTFSGGGFRAMLNGAGYMAAADERTPDSLKSGGLGGLLQSCAYLVGLSGGAWLVGSLVMNNFPSPYEIVYSNNSLWRLGINPLIGVPIQSEYEAVIDKGMSQFLSSFYQREEEGIIDGLDESSDISDKELLKRDFIIEGTTTPEYYNGVLRRDGWPGFDLINTEGIVSKRSEIEPNDFLNSSEDIGKEDLFGSDEISPQQVSDQTKEIYKQFHDHLKYAFGKLKEALESNENQNASSSNPKSFSDGVASSDGPDSEWSGVVKYFQQILQHYDTLFKEISPKKEAGFQVSITDLWARALSRAFLDTSASLGLTFSNAFATLPGFLNHQIPFPIFIADATIPNQLPTCTNSTIMEMTPVEFGSWGRKLHAFMKTRYLGTSMKNGEPTNQNPKACVEGFDNGAFLLATSSSVFNDFAAMCLRRLGSKNGVMRSMLNRYKEVSDFVLNKLDSKGQKYRPDYALYAPNPFLGYNEGIAKALKTFKDYNEKEKSQGRPGIDRSIFLDDGSLLNSESFLTTKEILYMTDGGYDQENVPFDPLLRPERKVDIIFAVDSSSDRERYPNGTALYHPSLRYNGPDSLEPLVSYPNIPGPPEIVKRGLHKVPRFYGCDIESGKAYGHRQFDVKSDVLPPLIAYFPNRKMTSDSNFSTAKMSYTSDEIKSLVQNGYSGFTNGNSTEFTQCLGCAIFQRSYLRSGETIPEFCQTCFNTYCFN